MKEWRVLICGGRDYGYENRKLKKKNLEQIRRIYEIVDMLASVAKSTDKNLIIIHGAAQGADEFADEAASFFGLEILPFPADWKQYPKAAGPIRNRQMLKEGKPDLIVAFPGGAGTENMCSIAQKENIPIRRIK